MGDSVPADQIVPMVQTKPRAIPPRFPRLMIAFHKAQSASGSGVSRVLDRSVFLAMLRAMMLLAMALVMTLVLAGRSRAEGAPFTNQQLTEGFMRTVFGLEYRSWSWQPYLVKKYTGPVRFYVHNLAENDRRAVVHRFVLNLSKQIRGLQTMIEPSADSANFHIYIVDRVQYEGIVRKRIYDNPRADAPGRCLVRVLSGKRGITGSSAVIVSDEGEFLFRRCLVEEVLQGLGPMNDDESLEHSVFNDTSRHARFTPFDRYILNMLYDRRIKPGMNSDAALTVLPVVIRDTRKRLN